MKNPNSGNRYGAYVKYVPVYASNPKPYHKPSEYAGYTVKRVSFALPYDYIDPTWPPSWYAKDLINSRACHDALTEVFFDSAANKALDKLYDKMGQLSDLRVAWKERQTAVDQLTSGIRSLVTIIRAVKRRDPKIVRKVLRKYKNEPDIHDLVKTPAGLWLGYWFGVAPTVSDIHHAAGIFNHEFPVLKLDAVGGFSDEVAHSDTHSTIYRLKCKIGGNIVGIDPHVSLASRLGFGQPLSVGLEMVPFSWLVGYFVNIDQLVRNLEPQFPGIQIADKYTTYVGEYSSAEWYSSTDYLNATCYFHRRKLGWPDYTLETSGLEALNLKRLSYITSVAAILISDFVRRK